VTYGAAWKMIVGSWDRLLIPFPFSRVTYVAGQPITVPADASPELLEAKRQELENSLIAITTLADALCASPQAAKPAKALVSKHTSHTSS
jgi:hypothetical protein